MHIFKWAFLTLLVIKNLKESFQTCFYCQIKTVRLHANKLLWIGSSCALEKTGTISLYCSFEKYVKTYVFYCD